MAEKEKTSRGRVALAVTGFQEYVQALHASQVPLEKVEIIMLQTKLDKIEPKHSEFCEWHYAVCDIEGEDDNELVSFEKVFYSSVAHAKNIIEEFYAGERAERAQDDGASQVSNGSNGRSVEAAIKLPAIALPKFSGKPENWLEFRDVFQSLIHDDPSLNNIKKFYYLKASLEHDAKKIIQGVATSSENYMVAWQALCERFENKALLVRKHLDALINIVKESASQLRNMIDKINEHVRALTTLERPVGHWDDILIHILCSKLDATTMRDWETTVPRAELPNLNEFLTFLRKRASVLESVQYKETRSSNAEHKTSHAAKYPNSKAFTIAEIKCYYCKEKHPLYYCNTFKELSVSDRKRAAQDMKLCLNCLRVGHKTSDCDRTGCRICHKRHNSILHASKCDRPEERAEVPAPDAELVLYAPAYTSPEFVFLSTAIIDVLGENGQTANARALADNGSQSNFITSKLARSLGICVRHTDRQISGISRGRTYLQGTGVITFRSAWSPYTQTIECLVVPEISDMLIPQISIAATQLTVPSSIQLADPTYNIPGPIDVLLGASVFSSVLKGEILRLGKNKPCVLNTELGWMVCGTLINPKQPAQKQKCYLHKDRDISGALSRFWEIEEFPDTPPLSEEQSLCESHFAMHTRRDEAGRFHVRIPLKGSIDMLGHSFDGAKKRLMHLEHKLSKNPELRQKYNQFMREYELLGHMTEMPNVDISNPGNYFLPHHAVINANSATTKLRVVFDGSFKTSSHISRNQIECVGPQVQQDLMSILLRFRTHKIAICADIEKMYRQITVDPRDRPLQNILWRDDPEKTMKTFQLNTVTYGTSSGSFLATRCVVELGRLADAYDPRVGRIIREDFYVDDVITGCDSEEDAELLCVKLNEILNSACLPLQKWSSNATNLFDNIQVAGDPHKLVSLTKEDCTKTLGLHWSQVEDCLRYEIGEDSRGSITKRTVLSETSRIFDPLGLLGACIITAKILLQDLWKCKLGWDDMLPKTVFQAWTDFRSELRCLNKLRIPRFCLGEDNHEIQLHGFADASEKAYGACVYVRTETAGGQVRVRLLCAKSKVAPVKVITMPRLELSASLVLAKLVKKITDSLRANVTEITMWSDSTIVLGWLARSPDTLKVFVANRVAKIHALTKNHAWRHVASKDNPADLISRGISPKALLGATLWWHGPRWLSETQENWPPRETPTMERLPEIKNLALPCVVAPVGIIDFSRFSNYARLVRTIAYVNRFIERCRSSARETQTALSSEEISNAIKLIVKVVQTSQFPNEVHCLRARTPLSPSSKLLSMHPFIDQGGLIRVGGRLQNSELPYDARHPILLPANHAVSKLLCLFEHKRSGHAGPQLLLCKLRQQFWILRGKDAARETVRKCVICYKARPHNSTPLMGNLPTGRVTASATFDRAGVDYAGPFTIKDRKGRGAKTYKAYISLFICFAVKAVHLEVVSDLTTEAFIAALKRFISRRGKPSAIYSDNGTNFVGANNELRRIIGNLSKNQIMEAFSMDEITWHFIPPHSPNFGGLWEAGIRSVKSHLKRIVGNLTLTYEELSTICCQIEAFLNSRPLTPLSNNPNDLEALTPHHFLSGRKLLWPPEDTLLHLPDNRLSRYQFLQKVSQHFWKRWSGEYLNTLQSRGKWKRQSPAAVEGALVIIQDDTQPSIRWPLARIIQAHPGSDGVIRVVSLRTSRGVLRRAVSKVYPLPLDQECRDESEL